MRKCYVFREREKERLFNYNLFAIIGRRSKKKKIEGTPRRG